MPKNRSGKNQDQLQDDGFDHIRSELSSTRPDLISNALYALISALISPLLIFLFPRV